MAEFIEAKGIEVALEPEENFVTEMTEQEAAGVQAFLVDEDQEKPAEEAKVYATPEEFVEVAKFGISGGPLALHAITLREEGEPNAEAVSYIQWRNKVLGNKPLSKFALSELHGVLKQEPKGYSDKLLASHKKLMIRKGQNASKVPTSSIVIEASQDIDPEAIHSLMARGKGDAQIKNSSGWYEWLSENVFETLLDVLLIVLAGVAGWYTAKFVTGLFGGCNCCVAAAGAVIPA